MKTFLMALMMSFSSVAMAENVDTSKASMVQSSLVGKVVDARSGEPLAGAEVRCGDHSVFTNFDGEFFLPASIKGEEVEVEVRLISYQESKQKIRASSTTSCIIKLRS